MKTFSSSSTNAQQPTPEQIAVAVYHLYLENGCRDGYELDDWLCAEKLLTQEMAKEAQVQFAEPSRKVGRSTPEIAIHEMDESRLVRAKPGPTKREESWKKTAQLPPPSYSYRPPDAPNTMFIQTQAA